jgi:hypothetical protein
MDFDRFNIDQISNGVGSYCFIPFYTALANGASKYSYIRYFSMIVGACDGYLSIAQTILGVFEAVVKGVTNFAISFFDRGKSAYLGLMQLSGAFWITAASPLSVFFRVLNVTWQFYKDPHKFSISELDKFLKIKCRSNC